MSCYKPLTAYRSKERDCNNKYTIVFDPAQAYDLVKIQLPCGKCIGCRLEYSRQWAMRCMHEVSLHDKNCFITLTYDDEHLPKNKSLIHEDFQYFMKRLRKKYGNGIRFFQCGEYGEVNGRPHYHAILFNHDFDDRTYLKTVNGYKYYNSQSLLDLWHHKGMVHVGDAEWESCAYVARYITKKINPGDKEHKDKFFQKYGYWDPETGELFHRKVEYTSMSTKPGIGKEWFNKYHKEVYHTDSVVFRGMEMKPPKYYDNQFEIIGGEKIHTVKEAREKEALKRKKDNTRKRLKAREEVHLARAKLLKRGLHE
jgi:hypothetical protein